MLKKSLTIMLITLSFNFSIVAAGTGPQTKKDTGRAAKVKEEIVSRSTSERKSVQIKLLDGREITGYILEAGEDTFLIGDVKTGQSTAIAYADVKRVGGKGLSTVTKIAIGWMAVGFVMTLLGVNK